MSDEVKRLCNVIIRHVADGATIFEKDHAAIIDTMRSQQAEIERLRGIVREIIEMLDYDRTSERYRVAVDAALGATQ